MAVLFAAGNTQAQSAAEFDARGNAWRAKGEWEKALFEYNHAIRLSPRVASYYYDRGRNHLDKHDLVWARADFDQAIRLDPTDARAWLARGVLQFADGHLAAAADDFAAALARAPTDAETRLWLHVARARLGTEDPDLLRRAVDELKPDACDSAFFSGEMELLQGKSAPAAFRRAAEACAPDRLARVGVHAETIRARR